MSIKEKNKLGMPLVGYGLWKVPKEDCADLVYTAIQRGYRHFDSACDYGNEKEVGEGIKRAIDDSLCTREELWITSKLWNTYHAKAHVKPALQKTLDDLQLDYLDLYLIHFPIALKYVDFEERYPPDWVYDTTAELPKMDLAKVPLHETWEGMETLHDKGLVKNIGVCNYNSALMFDLVNYARIKPSVLQIEVHPYLTQEKLIQVCKNLDIEVTAFSPLGALSYVELSMAKEHDSLLEHETIVKIAKTHEKTPAQILLRWGVQRGTAIIPKTSNPERMSENLSIFDFELTEEEMSEISSLNQNRRFNDPGVFCQLAFNTLYPIYD